LIRDVIDGLGERVYRSRVGLWLTRHDVLVSRHRNVLAVLVGPEGRRLVAASNIVTDAGDQYYAQRMAEEAVTNAFTSLYLSEGAWDAGHPAKGSTADNLASVIAGSEKAADAGYPKTNDDDTDNDGSGVDVVSWRFSYSKADFSSSAIVAGTVSIAAATFGGASGDPLLTGFDLSSFSKTSNDTLKFFVNHTQNGV